MISRRACLIGGLLVFAAALVYFASYADYGLAYDEGYLLEGVERLMDGQLIYRDFHHTYAPGRFYAVAAAFGLFGKNIMVERYIFVFLQALKCGLAFTIVAALTRSWLALLAPALIMLAPGPWHKVFFSSFGFLALYVMIRSLRSPPRRLIFTGIVIGLCAVFRQDSAGFAVIGGLIGMVIDAAANTAKQAADRQRAGKSGVWRSLAARIAFLALGIAIIGIPVLLFFHFQDGLGPMFEKMTREGMIDNMTNRIEFPSIMATGSIDSAYLANVLPVRLLFYLPFAVYVLGLLLVIVRAARRRWTETMTGFAVVLAAAVLAFNQTVWRSDLGHLLQSMQYVFLLASLLVVFASSGLEGRWSGRGRLKVAAGLVLVLLLPALLVWASAGIVRGVNHTETMKRFHREGVSIVDTEYLGSIAVRQGNDTRLGLDRVPVRITPGEARFFTVLGQYLDSHTSPGDYVLALPQLQMLYFFYDRRNPTRYAHYRRALDPGEETRYIEDIDSHDTEYIFFTEPPGGGGLGQTRTSFSEYAVRVRAWIFENYAPEGRIGSVQILRRKP